MDILNLGCGNRIIKGAVNVDRIRHRPEVDVVHDLNMLPWPFGDDSFDFIVACAILEHLRLNLIESIDECWRILRPGGHLHIKLPHWQSDASYIDPTHYWKFSLSSLDVFDPTTRFGREYSFYTPRKWKIVEQAKLNRIKSSFGVKLQVVK